MRFVGTVFGDDPQNIPPLFQQLLLALLVIQLHHSADICQVVRRHSRQNPYEVIGRVVVGDVRHLVEVRELDPVPDRVSVLLVVRIW